MSIAPMVWVLLAVLAIALLAALAVIVVLWRRMRVAKPLALALPQDVAQLQKPMFAAAMAALYPRDADNRYDKPCVLVCGAQATGKSELLRTAGMEPVTALAGKDSGWWKSSEGVAFELPGVAWDAHGQAWTDFLRLLDRHRGRRALDAVVWVVPFATLDNGTVDGDRMYRKFVDIQDRLGLRLPVYVIVSGCDQAAGFASWAARLPEGLQGEPLGWSNPGSLGTVWRGQDGERGVATVLQRLRRLVSALSARRDLGLDAAAIFAMPERVGAALCRLPPALLQAMRQNAVLTPFDLRGLYLCGRSVAASDAPAPPADPFSAAPAPPPPPAPLFCRELFVQRVFGEFGLAMLVPRRLKAERRSQLLLLGGAGLVAAVWLIALVPAWFTTRDQLDTIRRPLLGVKNAVLAARALPPEATAQIDERGTIALLEEMDKVPDWSTPAVALPLSWSPCCGGLRSDIDGALQAYFSEVLFRNIDYALLERARTLTTASTGATSAGGELATDPGQMRQYNALAAFVDGTLEYEYESARFGDIISDHNGSWSTAVRLLRYLFGIELAAASPTTVARFDRILQQSTYQAAARPADFRRRFAAHLWQLHNEFTARMFSDNRLHVLQRALVEGVQALDASAAEPTAALAGLQRDIGELRILLTRTDAVWMADGHLVTSDAYRRIENNIRKSRLLGEKLADALHADASRQQLAFRQRVEADSSGTYPVLAYTEGKQLLVNPDLAGLEQALGQLLQHRFTQGAAQATAPMPDPEVALAWTVDQLGAARGVLDDLQTYEATELAKAPLAYQDVLRKLARLQAGALVDQELAAAALPAACETAWRCSNFDEARQAMAPLLASMRKLDLAMPAERWQHLMDRQAMALLRALNRAIDQDKLYLPDARAVAAWDGMRAGAPLAYGVRAPAEMQDYLDRQLALVAELAQASKGPRAWLAQGGAAAPRDAQAALADWTRIDAELARHAAKAPGGSLRRLEQWVTDDLAGMDSTNCATRLAGLTAPDPDLFQRRLAQVAAVYRPYCITLETQVARTSYGQIATQFNQFLLNRFPFAAARDAAPADPEDVRRLLQILEANLPTLRATLGRQQDPASRSALGFVERLAAVQPVLAALLADDPAGGPAALDLWPQFRINRPREQGADQIIEWTLRAGDVLPAPPPGGAPGVAWRLGQPIAMALRWAKNSTLAPAASPARPDMRVADGSARWQYDDPWALLHLLRDHAAPQSDLAERDARVPVVLRFVVPTRDAGGAPAADAVAYARLAVSVHGKPERLAVPPFPTGAAPALRDDARAACCDDRQALFNRDITGK